MTNAINSGLPIQADPANSAPVPRAGSTAATLAATSLTGPTGATSTEAVTVSADAQTRIQLLDAARTAPGIDSQRISQTRNAIQSNSYNVPPEDLATAIATALKERQP